MAKKKNENNLTDYQQKFVEEYLKDLNQAQASIRAGYKGKTSTAKISASRMMSNPNVRSEIDRRIKERGKKNEITADMVLLELAAIAFSDIRKVFNDKNDMLKISKIDDKTAKAISSIEIEVDKAGDKVFSTTKKIKFNDKIRALQLVGNHIGMFRESTSGVEDIANALRELARGLPD